VVDFKILEAKNALLDRIRQQDYLDFNENSSWILNKSHGNKMRILLWVITWMKLSALNPETLKTLGDKPSP